MDSEIGRDDKTNKTSWQICEIVGSWALVQPSQREFYHNISKWKMSGLLDLPIQFLGIYLKEITA